MGAIRATTAAVLIFAFAAVAAADCVTDARQISSRTAVPNLIAGPSAWSGFGLAVAKSEPADRNAIWIAVYDEMLQTLVPDVQVVDDAADASAIIDSSGTDSNTDSSIAPKTPSICSGSRSAASRSARQPKSIRPACLVSIRTSKWSGATR